MFFVFLNVQKGFLYSEKLKREETLAFQISIVSRSFWGLFPHGVNIVVLAIVAVSKRFSFKATLERVVYYRACVTFFFMPIFHCGKIYTT